MKMQVLSRFRDTLEQCHVTAEFANPGLWEKWENAIESSASEMVQSRSSLFCGSLYLIFQSSSFYFPTSFYRCIF